MEIKNKIAITLMLLFSLNISHSQARFTVPCKPMLLQTSMDTAFAQVGTKEKSNHNDGEVEKYLKCVGLSKGQPYCAAGQYYCFFQAATALHLLIKEIPIPRTGCANAMFDYGKKHGSKQQYKPFVHDLIVWKKKNQMSGHIERIVAVGQKGWVRTIGFNTSSGNNNQRDGEGVYLKTRNVFHPLGRLSVRGIIGFSSKENK